MSLIGGEIIAQIIIRRPLQRFKSLITFFVSFPFFSFYRAGIRLGLLHTNDTDNLRSKLFALPRRKNAAVNASKRLTSYVYHMSDDKRWCCLLTYVRFSCVSMAKVRSPLWFSKICAPEKKQANFIPWKCGTVCYQRGQIKEVFEKSGWL